MNIFIMKKKVLIVIKWKINEKYVNRESFLDMLNSYEEKLRGESMRVTKNGFKY